MSGRWADTTDEEDEVVDPIPQEQAVEEEDAVPPVTAEKVSSCSTRVRGVSRCVPYAFSLNVHRMCLLNRWNHLKFIRNSLCHNSLWFLLIYVCIYIYI